VFLLVVLQALVPSEGMVVFAVMLWYTIVAAVMIVATKNLFYTILSSVTENLFADYNWNSQKNAYLLFKVLILWFVSSDDLIASGI
jgi:hypothetical protein